MHLTKKKESQLGMKKVEWKLWLWLGYIKDSDEEVQQKMVTIYGQSDK